MSTPTDEEKRKLYAGERFYSAAEVALERAALLREVCGLVVEQSASWRNDVGVAWEVNCCKAVLAIPTDQSALARHDEELLKMRDKRELVIVSNVVIESLQEEIHKMREAISPGRQNVSCDYYIKVAKRLREKDTEIHLKESEVAALARVEAAAYERAKLVCGDWFLNWCNRVGVKVEESNIRQGIAALQDRG